MIAVPPFCYRSIALSYYKVLRAIIHSDNRPRSDRSVTDTAHNQGGVSSNALVSVLYGVLVGESRSPYAVFKVLPTLYFSCGLVTANGYIRRGLRPNRLEQFGRVIIRGCGNANVPDHPLNPPGFRTNLS